VLARGNAIIDALAEVDTTSAAALQGAVNEVGNFLGRLDTITTGEINDPEEAGEEPAEPLPFNSSQLVDIIKDIFEEAATHLPSNTSARFTSPGGEMQAVISKGDTNCEAVSEADPYDLIAATKDDAVNSVLPGACSGAYGEGGGGSVSMVLISSPSLHSQGLVGGLAIGNGAVVMVRIANYSSGTDFADGQVLEFIVPKPVGDIPSDACMWHDRSGPEPAWTSQGCTTTVGIFTVTCRCTHATSFGVMVAGSGSSGSDNEVVSIISYIGVCVSIVCFVLMLAFYSFAPKARQDRGKKIFLNILVMLLVTMVLFLISALGRQSSLGTDGCKVVAVLLQFSVLAAFAWMLMEGLHLFTVLTDPFSKVGGRPLGRLAVLVYGLPMVYVMVLSGAYWGDYGEQPSSGVCYISDRLIPSVYIPIALVGVINLYIFRRVWLAIASMPKSPRPTALQTFRKRAKSAAFKSASLFSVLGSTWLVGLLFLTGDRVFWEYPFILLNAFQGLWIFLTHGLYDRELRKELSISIHNFRRSSPRRSSSRRTTGSRARRGGDSLDEHGQEPRGKPSWLRQERWTASMDGRDAARAQGDSPAPPSRGSPSSGNSREDPIVFGSSPMRSQSGDIHESPQALEADTHFVNPFYNRRSAMVTSTRQSSTAGTAMPLAAHGRQPSTRVRPESIV